jgi:hypothetical protein
MEKLWIDEHILNSSSIHITKKKKTPNYKIGEAQKTKKNQKKKERVHLSL